MTALIEMLRKRGWEIREHPQPVTLLPDDLRSRYPVVPPAITDFLGRFEACHNAEENVWFLSAEDFRKRDDDGFRWNEYELMALENAEGEPAAQSEVRAFWNDHLPIMMAVHSDYDYLAVRLAEPNKGTIVHGCAPDWEEPSRVAGSFDEFLRQLAAEATSNNPEFPYSVFL